ncbi:MAG: histidine phosphatase family protein [Akkermansiaceae bacterium]|nr:histidine phosphatase family protein [Akkermansiaceae bacterium]
MKTLIIARHGNTSPKGETPTRVGSRTDLPLVEEERGRGIGKYLAKLGLVPTRILAAPLQRTMSTAALAAEELGNPCPVIPDARFIEVDYGPDENHSEEETKARLGADIARANGTDPATLSAEELDKLGEEAIEQWNAQAIVPPGWKVDVESIIRNWNELTAEIADGETLLCVSSNGTIRFAPYITGDYTAFCAEHDIKVATGGVCIFTSADGNTWTCQEWGVKAFKKI